MSRLRVRNKQFVRLYLLKYETTRSMAQLLPTLQKYIDLRQRLAGKIHTNNSLQSSDDMLDASDRPLSPRDLTKSASTGSKAKEESSRDMARQISLLSEEALRASQEKV